MTKNLYLVTVFHTHTVQTHIVWAPNHEDATEHAVECSDVGPCDYVRVSVEEIDLSEQRRDTLVHHAGMEHVHDGQLRT